MSRNVAVRLTDPDDPGSFACCYGMRRPRVAVPAGLLDRLDDEEPDAVLLHERRHQARRDLARNVALHIAPAATFMIPLVPILRRHTQARIEFMADRAALAVGPRGHCRERSGLRNRMKQ